MAGWVLGRSWERHWQDSNFTQWNPTRLNLNLDSSLCLKLCTQIEQLEQENQSLKKEDGAFAVTVPASPNSLTVDEELLRLQAENSALQKKMKGVYEAGLSVSSVSAYLFGSVISRKPRTAVEFLLRSSGDAAETGNVPGQRWQVRQYQWSCWCHRESGGACSGRNQWEAESGDWLI